MKILTCEKVIYGELKKRLDLNYSRLESEYYRPEYIFSADQAGWPGDWEGRTILALTRLWEATGRKPKYIDEIINELKKNLNPKGYLNSVYSKGVYNEQQLSGHNWLLRGLIELYKIEKRQDLFAIITGIIDNLYMPIIGAYLQYPAKPEQRVYQGCADGRLTGHIINGWHTSTDIGCAYMCLDALAQSYSELGFIKLKPLIEEMIETFMKIDLLGIQMQTHATLSATRGILRFFEAKRDKKYLEYAKEIFNLYESYGMNEFYGNYNWFNRRSWTEPCAIVDSFMLSFNLYKATNDIHYLEISHKIYLNAFGYAQRSNGGFGCDDCAGHDEQSLFVSCYGEGHQEAVWCCTMRGSEGLAEVLKNMFLLDEESIVITHYNAFSYEHNHLKMELFTEYPFKGEVNIKLSTGKSKSVALFLPSYSNDFTLTINEKKSICERENGFINFEITPGIYDIHFYFDIPVFTSNLINKKSIRGYQTINHGFCLMGTKKEIKNPILISDLKINNHGKLMCNDYEFEFINDMYTLPFEDILSDKRQILFETIR